MSLDVNSSLKLPVPNYLRRRFRHRNRSVGKGPYSYVGIFLQSKQSATEMKSTTDCLEKLITKRYIHSASHGNNLFFGLNLA